MKIKKIISGLFKSILKITEVILAFVIVIGGLGIGLLYIRPMEIKEFLPTLEKHVLPPDAGLKLDAESVTLRAAFRPEGLFHIDIKNMSVLNQSNDPIIDLPDVELSYTLKRLISLNYIPSNLTVKEAALYLIINPEGQVRLSAAEIVPQRPPKGIELSEKSDLIQKIIDKVLSFRALALENATVKIDDRQKNKRMDLTEVNLHLERQKDGHHALQISTTLAIQDKKTRLQADAQLNRKSQKMSFEATFDSLYLKVLEKDLPFLAGADLTVGGKITGIFDFAKTCQDIISCFKEGAFQIKTLEAGTLNLPAPLTNLYPVESATINGAISSDLEQIKIAKSTLVLKGGPTASLQVDVSGIGEFFAKGDLNAVKTTLKAELTSLPLSKVPEVWPVATGPDAHAWVKRNLPIGTVEKADFALYFTGGELTNLYGELPITGAEIRYLDGMTPVQNFAGTVKLYPDRVLITGDNGTIWNMKLTQAVIDLTDLQNDISNAKIVLDITGPVKEAMDLIAEKPLEFPQMFGLDPKSTAGESVVHVDLAFPLIDDLTTDKVKADVTAQITEGVFPTPLDKYDLKKGKLDLSVNNQRLLLTGTGEIAGIPLNIQWTESFTAQKDTDVRSDYEITSLITAEKLHTSFPVTTGYFDGEVDAKASIKVTPRNVMTADIQGDFQKAFLNIYPLSTQKPSEVPANARITARQDKNQTTLDFQFTGAADKKSLDPIQIKGTGTIGATSTQFNLNEVIAPKTNMKASFAVNGKDITLRLNGKSWNAMGLYDIPDTEPKTEPEKPFEFPENIDFDISLDRFILADGKPMTTLMAKGIKKDNRWQSLSINAMAGSPFNMSYLKKKDALTAHTPDLGAFLSHLGVTDKMSQGAFDLDAEQLPKGGFKGKIEAKDVVLKEPGFLLQASTILGIVDAIRGKDLLFSEGIVQFELKPDLSLNLELTESYLAGNSLGITFMGTVIGSELALTGSVIPAYMINSLPGKIPLVGVLFKDSEAGGLIGAKYDIKGKLSNPEVTFHPLNSMAPGILGKIFN